MACFLVPAAEAAVVTVLTKITARKSDEANHSDKPRRITFASKLKWLSNMLWGGSALLAFEHLWHGEIVPWFPFLTAMNDPAETAEMFHEMSTIGVTMALLVTLAWGGMVLAINRVKINLPANEVAKS